MSAQKIAWILYGSLDQRTGGTIYDARIVDGLRDHGHHVDVISLSRSGSLSASSVVRQLRRLSPDVIVGDELCFRELAFIFRRTGFAHRLLLVHHLTCWEDELRPSARMRARRWESPVCRHADSIVATSCATRDRLVHEGNRGRIDVALPGADRLPLHPRSSQRSEAGVVFLFIGSIIERKRVRELVQSFMAITRKENSKSPSLRLAGSRDREPAYVRELDRLMGSEHTARATFLGEIDEDALAMELANADVLVMPSSLEGYGIAATEAVRAGIPVIAARTPGLEEALRPCADAVVFFDAPTDLGPAMQDVATNATRLGALTEAAQRARMPSWSEAVSAFRRALPTPRAR